MAIGASGLAMASAAGCLGTRGDLMVGLLVPKGEDRGLDAVLQIEFRQDVTDVGFYGLLADYQLAGDLTVAMAAGDEVKDSAFAPREGFERVGRGWAAEGPSEPGYKFGAEFRSAGGGGADGGDDFVGGGGFEQVGGGTGVHGADEVLVVGGGGEYDDGGLVWGVT